MRSATSRPQPTRPAHPLYLNRFTLVCGSTGAKSLQSQFGSLHGATRSFPDQWWMPTPCPQRHSFFLFFAMPRCPKLKSWFATSRRAGSRGSPFGAAAGYFLGATGAAIFASRKNRADSSGGVGLM